MISIFDTILNAFNFMTKKKLSIGSKNPTGLWISGSKIQSSTFWHLFSLSVINGTSLTIGLEGRDFKGRLFMFYFSLPISYYFCLFTCLHATGCTILPSLWSQEGTALGAFAKSRGVTISVSSEPQLKLQTIWSTLEQIRKTASQGK